MHGILTFALGLESRSFLSSLSSAQSRLAGLLGTTISVGGAAATVWAQISKGAHLFDLSMRSGVSAGTIFKLQRGFEEVGLSGEQVTSVIYRLQRAIGGLSMEGESTKEAFGALGLSPDALRRVGDLERLQAVITAMGQANGDTAAFASSRIFGRGGAQDMLQLARSAGDFAEAMHRSAAAGALFDRHAAAMDRAKDSLMHMKWAFLDMTLKVAGPIADVLGSAEAAANAGKLGELIGLSLTVAFEKSLNFLWQGLQKIGAAIPGLLSGAGTGARGMGEWLLSANAGVLSSVFDWMAQRTGNQANHGYYEDIAAAFAQVSSEMGGSASDRRQKAISDMAAAITNGAMASTNALPASEAEKRLAALIASLSPATAGGMVAGGMSPLAGGTTKEKEFGLDANSLERIGAIFTGGRAGTDYARETAYNTRRLYTTSEKTLEEIRKFNTAKDPRVFNVN